MKILVFSEVFHPEDFMINDLVREWVKMGHEVEVSKKSIKKRSTGYLSCSSLAYSSFPLV